METYTLVVLVALFLGVIGIIAMLEQRRRTELTRFEQLEQILSTCVQALNGIHANNYAQFNQLAEAVNQVRAEVQSANNAVRNASEILRSEIGGVVEHSAIRIDKSVQAALQNQSADIVGAVDGAARQIQKAHEAATQEIRNAMRAVEALKASLEESVKF